MKKIFLKILEGIALAGMVVFLGFLFLIELIDLFIVRPLYQKLFKKKRRRKRLLFKKFGLHLVYAMLHMFFTDILLKQQYDFTKLHS